MSLAQWPNDPRGNAPCFALSCKDREAIALMFAIFNIPAKFPDRESLDKGSLVLLRGGAACCLTIITQVNSAAVRLSEI
jgi:hypothetical protein